MPFRAVLFLFPFFLLRTPTYVASLRMQLWHLDPGLVTPHPVIVATVGLPLSLAACGQ